MDTTTSTCTICEVGTFTDVVGTPAECTPCDIGSYSDAQGATVCTQCDTGSTTSAIQSTSAAACGMIYYSHLYIYALQNSSGSSAFPLTIHSQFPKLCLMLTFGHYTNLIHNYSLLYIFRSMYCWLLHGHHNINMYNM